MPSATPRMVGLIVPPPNGGVPPECDELYGDEAVFAARSAELTALDLAGYREAEARLPSLARQLASEGAEALVLMGTSLSFHGGAAHTRALEKEMAEASGRPATSMSSAVHGALSVCGSRRVALATAYVDEVNEKLVEFLTNYGFEVSALRALQIRDVDDIRDVTEDDLVELGTDAIRADESADTLFISCGGLRTLKVTRRLEEELGRPVISSAVSGAWAAASLAGVDARRTGFGSFLESRSALPESFVTYP